MTAISLHSDPLGYFLSLADAPRCDTAPVSRAWRCATYRVKWETLREQAKSRETLVGRVFFELHTSRLFKQRSHREKERDVLLVAFEQLRALYDFVASAEPLPKPFEVDKIDAAHRRIIPLVQEKRDRLIAHFFTESIAPRLPNAHNPILYQYEPRTAEQIRLRLPQIAPLLQQLLFSDLAPFLDLPELLAHPLLSDPQIAQLFLHACKRGDGDLLLRLLQTDSFWRATLHNKSLLLTGVTHVLASQSLNALYALFSSFTARGDLELLTLGIQSDLPLPFREFFHVLAADLPPREFLKIPMERPLRKKLFKTFSKEKQGQLAQLNAYCLKLLKRYEAREPHPPLPRTRLDDLTIALRALPLLSRRPLSHPPS